MNNLDSVNSFLTERLMTVAAEIFQVFKDAFSEYQGEVERIKHENRCLREALAEIYNSVHERSEKHSLNQRALNTDTFLLQASLKVEASPKKSNPQQSQNHPQTCKIKLEHIAQDLQPDLSFSDKTGVTDENEENEDSSSSLHTAYSVTVKVEPCASQSQAVFSAEVKNEAESEADQKNEAESKADQATDQQEPFSLVEASPKKSNPQQSQNHPQTCKIKLEHIALDLQPDLSFSDKTGVTDENEDSSNSLHNAYSVTVKVEPGASQSQAVFSAEVKNEGESEADQATDQQELFSCTYCDQTFTDVAHKESHMAMFTCGICRKSFKLKGTLKTHMIVHQKERPFSCSYCKKQFKLKCHLKEHERIHTGEKPFSCPVCGRCFTRTNHMKMHLRNHHREQL